MTVQAMGYFWIGTSKLDDWTSLADGQLGLQAVDRGGAIRAFRMDDRKQRLIVDGGMADGERFFGWEVADATALDRPSTAVFTNPWLYDNLSFNFIRDIAPVGSVTKSAFIIVTDPSFPPKTIPELIAYAKANPGEKSPSGRPAPARSRTLPANYSR